MTCQPIIATLRVFHECGGQDAGGFWHTRWANQIGFHLDEINPYLMRHLSRLRLQAGERILVPLCGKTLDLAWLAAQGLEVLGWSFRKRP